MDISKKISFKTYFNTFSEIEETDNKIIYNLRKVSDESNLLYQKDYSLEAQKEYFRKNYLNNRKKRREIYFKINPISNLIKTNGFVRITNLQNFSNFSWDSLIVANQSPPWFAIDITLSIYSLGFDYFKKKKCGLWTVPKKGLRVKNFHLKMGLAKIVKEDENFFYFNVSKKDYKNKIVDYKKLNIGRILDLNIS